MAKRRKKRVCIRTGRKRRIVCGTPVPASCKGGGGKRRGRRKKACKHGRTKAGRCRKRRKGRRK